ncbi:4a-hydroxytetrahydrobiopterin dehydratase [Amphritea balenae]|uniref:Putative pterin-4-alpha-carbinolamine dehydratase n=1 Tax=Amphritea balenae TaxID=452629 RepID=A0A3P1SNZ7_9GAMM|nr:4a-hydroxytetrahydrobiopterin dehydratase [Amphritea balenae]RRC98971.1 4a-hydroxytetrahydrobiopterin dehydratase [Amphritea balenae]
MKTTDSLGTQECAPCSSETPVLHREDAEALLKQLSPGWQLSDDGKQISKDYPFKNFYRTMAFVNALAWIANRENHHPDFEVGYNHCLVNFSTHAIDGLSQNDFICAAKVDALVS